MYFVRRKGRVKGPLTLEKLRALRDEDRLRMRDEIAESADGPWKRLTEVYVELLDGAEAPGDADSAVDDEFWEEKSAAGRINGTKQGSTGKASAKPRQQASLFGGQVKPWQLVAGGITAAGLASAAFVAGLMLSPVGDQPTDPVEIAATANEAGPARRPAARKRPVPSEAVTAPPASETKAAATEPAGGSGPEATATAAAERAAPALPDTPTNRPPEGNPIESDLIESDPLTVRPKRPKVPTDLDHAAAIAATLTKYYSASSWQDRYQTVLQNAEVARLMQPMYEDVDWISVDWSITKSPAAGELAAAAQNSDPVRIDTLTNGNPHSIYLVFDDGRWRVDWLRSLNTLWLTK